MKMIGGLFYIIFSIFIVIGIIVTLFFGIVNQSKNIDIKENIIGTSKNSTGEINKNYNKINTEKIRKASFAGQFYPASKNDLEGKIKFYLSKSEKISKEGKVRMLVVPHAGYDYSGQIAGNAFKQIEGESYKRVILLGASHTSYFSHAAVYSNGAWETPLGKVEIDEDLALGLTDENFIKDDSLPFEKEHSLEVELPFLQSVLSDFKIVPILVSQVSDEMREELAFKIAQNFDDETLLVVSSDLSHYPTGEVAVKSDGEVIESILTGNYDRFSEKVRILESQGLKGLDTAICGQKAVGVALKVIEFLGLKDFEKIAYTNSGEVTGDNSRVVGYGTVGVWSKETPTVFSKEFEKEALGIARKTLNGYLNGGEMPEELYNFWILKRNLGAFVTLKNKGELRGCIGVFEPDKPLGEVIKDRTIAAACKDTRFEPVIADELNDIKIEISIITPKRKITDWRSIKLGKHGVIIQAGSKGGTFLPQVAMETGWSLERFLSELCSQKAGLPTSCYIDPATQIYVYEAKVFGEE